MAGSHPTDWLDDVHLALCTALPWLGLLEESGALTPAELAKLDRAKAAVAHGRRLAECELRLAERRAQWASN